MEDKDLENLEEDLDHISAALFIIMIMFISIFGLLFFKGIIFTICVYIFFGTIVALAINVLIYKYRIKKKNEQN